MGREKKKRIGNLGCYQTAFITINNSIREEQIPLNLTDNQSNHQNKAERKIVLHHQNKAERELFCYLKQWWKFCAKRVRFIFLCLELVLSPPSWTSYSINTLVDYRRWSVPPHCANMKCKLTLVVQLKWPLNLGSKIEIRININLLGLCLTGSMAGLK